MRRMCQAMGRQCLTESEEMRAEGPFEADVMAAERPAMVHVAVDGGEGERKDAPQQRVVKDRDVVRDRHETFLPRFVFCSRLEEIEKAGKAIDFGLVEAKKEDARQGCNQEDCLVGGRSPEEAGDFGVVIEVITGGHYRRAIAETPWSRVL